MEECGAFIDQLEGYKSKLSSRIPKDEEEDLENEDFKVKTIFIPKSKKRKQPSCNQLGEMKEELLDGEQGQGISKRKTKTHRSCNRWSDERYQQAEQRMWELLKAAGANFANPISRHALRKAARQHIGDTGLLDHLLKQIDGKIAPGGTERFRRCYNPQGIMKYWLESSHLDKARQEAGVQDPYWRPPSNFSAGNAPSQNTDSSCELKLLQIEMAKMKRDMQELIYKKQEKNEHSLMEVTQKELVKFKAMTEECLSVMSTSLKGMQGMYDELVTWKTKVDQQLAEIANKLNDLQSPQEQTNTGLPPEEWEGWLENFNLDNIPGDGLVAWLDGTEMLDVKQEVVHHDPILPLPSPPCYKEPKDAKSNLLEITTERQQEDQPDVTPCSSMTPSPKSDLDNNTFIVFQGMLMELFKWKDKMEQQLLEASNSVHMLKMKYGTA
ncbi:hypothetical protein QN277_025766 [Acacia crassicarpa]|uniref:PTC1-like winged helix-turn-helix domain-containing protein n=1 Tax=Acacia crassicarpa TaxID=499986 RepID=A0AAE1J9V2_9FABA|nr:hypothetical protein QN277_025766 [Acacia crassicarpa]